MSTFIYGILWILCHGLSRIFLHYRTKGIEHVPRKGGVLLAANHASYSDIPLLGCGVWRRLFYLGRASLFPNPLVNWILQALGWIPLKTERWDRQAFKHTVSLLKDGKAVVIFPEGGRSSNGELQPGKPGIGMIVAEAQCSVVPVYIAGSYKVLPMGASWIRLHPVEVIFGEPMDFTQDMEKYQNKALYKHISEKVMARIAELSRMDNSAVSIT